MEAKLNRILRGGRLQRAPKPPNSTERPHNHRPPAPTHKTRLEVRRARPHPASSKLRRTCWPHEVTSDSGTGAVSMPCPAHPSTPAASLPPFRPPAVSTAFLALLTVEMERLAVDYSNTSQYAPGFRARADERKRYLHASSDQLPRESLPVGELEALVPPTSSAPTLFNALNCSRQPYLLADSSTLISSVDDLFGRRAALERAVRCHPARRALVVAMREAPRATGHGDVLNCQLLPLLEGWGYSFDPISTARLAEADWCTAWSAEKRRFIRCIACCVNGGTTSGAPLLFFVADERLLRLGPAKTGSDAVSVSTGAARVRLGSGLSAADMAAGGEGRQGVGLLLSGDLKYLPVARTVVQTLRKQSQLPAVVVGPDNMRPPVNATAKRLASFDALNTGWPRGVSLESLELPRGALPRFNYVCALKRSARVPHTHTRVHGLPYTAST